MINKPLHTHYHQQAIYITKDLSGIRELMHPQLHSVQKQSLAEATIDVGKKTVLHKHLLTEELYFIRAGEGMMTLAENTFPVAEGDTVCISPNIPHCIENTGEVVLQILCCCSPAYSHEDTELLED